MFTIEQIDDLHARLGSAKTLPEYVQASPNRDWPGEGKMQNFAEACAGDTA